MLCLFDVHNSPMLHLNLHWCAISCVLEGGMHNLCIIMSNFDLILHSYMYTHTCV